MLRLAPAIALTALLAIPPAFAEDAHHPEAIPVQAQTQAPGMPMGGPGQTMPGGADCPMMGHWGPGGPGGPGAMMGGPGMAAHIDGHVAFLKAELKITPAQEQAWKPFEEALRTAAATMGQMAGMPAAGAQSMDEIFQLRQRLLTTRLENSKRLQAAWSKLDPALTPEQRARAQQLLGPRLMMM